MPFLGGKAETVFPTVHSSGAGVGSKMFRDAAGACLVEETTFFALISAQGTLEFCLLTGKSVSVGGTQTI